jgi:hypothetical protein
MTARQTVSAWLSKFNAEKTGSSRARYIARARSALRDPVTGRWTVSKNEPDPRIQRGRKLKGG